MLLHVVTELLLFLAELDVLLVAQVGVRDGTIRAEGPRAACPSEVVRASNHR